MPCCIYILWYVNKEAVSYPGSIVLVNVTTKTLQNFGDKEIVFDVTIDTTSMVLCQGCPVHSFDLHKASDNKTLQRVNEYRFFHCLRHAAHSLILCR